MVYHQPGADEIRHHAHQKVMEILKSEFSFQETLMAFLRRN